MPPASNCCKLNKEQSLLANGVTSLISNLRIHQLLAERVCVCVCKDEKTMISLYPRPPES